ncbi:MAG: 3-phosphoshikimate 1-carboxyvinyltransferase [Clostridia bacterium]|nr:3-phosphoshikimate 1-carboxyvinyltransferase [Clostridia bacterium]
MTVEIRPGKAQGCLMAPTSKSMAHRYLIAAALAKGKSVVCGIAYSQDILATMDCLAALGVKMEQSGDAVTVWGGTPLLPMNDLLCRESGSTLRFMLPLCLLSGKEATLRGSQRLMERPLSVYEALAAEKGFTLRRDSGAVTVCGRLEAGVYEVDGSVSSQFITGLVFALLTRKGESRIHLTGKVESRSYIDLTLDALNEFGFHVSWETENTLCLASGEGTPREITVEGDYSNAAFFDALTLLDGTVQVKGLKEHSLQGDRIYRSYFKELAQGTPTLSLANCPDLGPVLFAVAAALNGGVFTDTARLKIKESDRGAAMAEELEKCGVQVVLEENRIVVPGGQLKVPCEKINGHNDHRIVMAMAVLLTRTGGVLEEAEAVSKSMPDFFEKLSSLGIEVKINETK